MNPDPKIVNDWPADEIVSEPGLVLLIVGAAGPEIVMVLETVELPEELRTRTVRGPPARSKANTELEGDTSANTEVAEFHCVGSATPFASTIAVEGRFVPVNWITLVIGPLPDWQ